jgi:ABC-type Na+ efflux pump permease subunit
LLATISPEELMYGKLLGTVGVGLTMIAVWIGCGAVAAFATQGEIADMIRPALAPLTSRWARSRR